MTDITGTGPDEILAPLNPELDDVIDALCEMRVWAADHDIALSPSSSGLRWHAITDLPLADLERAAVAGARPGSVVRLHGDAAPRVRRSITVGDLVVEVTLYAAPTEPVETVLNPVTPAAEETAS